MDKLLCLRRGTKNMSQNFVKSKSGFSMPLLGLGTWQSREEEVERAVQSALSVGYRYIDTAAYYGNEKVIGSVLKAWMESGRLKREDLFIVTKLPPFRNRASEVEQCINNSLKDLQLDYLDIYLIHCPFTLTQKEDGSYDVDNSTDLIAVWKEMEKQVIRGKTRAIGISNFNIRQVEKILDASEIKPVTNQIEIHAYLQQPELVKYLKSKDIIVTAYCPLGSPGTEAVFENLGVEKNMPKLLNNPVVLELADKYGKTAAQILLRHLVQKDFSVIPKSVHPKRIAENINIFDFEIDSDDMKKMDELDCDQRILVFTEFFPGVDNHPEYPFTH